MGARAAAFLLLAVALLDPLPSSATYPGQNGRIVYPTFFGIGIPGVALWRLDPDRTGEAMFTTFPQTSAFVNPRWSPKGGRIAAWEGLARNAPYIYLVICAAGGETIGFTDLSAVLQVAPGNLANAGPTWSPDETKLAIALGTDPGGIYSVDVASMTSTQVLANPSDRVIYDQPAWSPDGSLIAVRIHQTFVGTYGHRDDIGVFPAGGGPVTNLTQNRNPDGSDGDAGCSTGGPNWRPDGRRIVYHEGTCERPIIDSQGNPEPDGRSRIAAVDVPGGALTELGPGARLVFPAYSPDGTTIVAWGIPYNQNQLTFFPADGLVDPGLVFTTATPLLAGPPDWQPDLGALTAVLAPDPPDVSVGSDFTLTMTVHNPSGDELTSVQPAGDLTLEGDGRIERISGPEPASVPALASGASQTFTWRYSATAKGTVVIKGHVEGHTPSGRLVTATARCGIGGASSPRAVGARAGCLPEGTEVTISQCTIDMIDDSPPVQIPVLDGDSTPPPGGHTYPKGGT